MNPNYALADSLMGVFGYRRMTCKKCGGNMAEGKAIGQTVTGIPDFPGDNECVTVSPGGPGKLIDCLKCQKCGWSVTK